MTKLVFRSASGEVQDVAIPELGATIGRSPDCTVPIGDPSVSGHHASIRFEHGDWWIHDPGSSNGTCVNGVEVKDGVLKDGDLIRFGNIECVFASKPVLPSPAAPAVQAPEPAPGPSASESSVAESASASVSDSSSSSASTGSSAKLDIKLPPKIELKPDLKLPPKPELKSGLKLPGKSMFKGKAPSAGTAPAQAAANEAAAPAKEAAKAPAPATGTPAPAKEAPAPAAAKASDWKPPVLEIPKEVALPEMADDDVALIAELKDRFIQIKEQLAQVVIGQTSVVEEVLVAVFSRGHALLVGVPGLAKTLLISTLARVLDLGFKRVQFTPDLMPSDITGTDVLEEDKASGVRRFRFVKGPVFTNMLLADEINRTPPKTQAALLEAMQEHHITVGAETYALDEPFFVLATQNPIEQEGTYPLPEAQMDRFMFNIVVDYPTAEEVSRIIASVTGAKRPPLDKILDGPTVVKLQDVVRRVPVAPHVVDYARNLARATRPKQPEAPDFVREMVGWGAGPRAGISLVQAAKARAILHGRHHATTADVTAVALPVLRHRVITTFAAEASGVKSDDVVRMLLQAMKPREDLDI